MKTCIHEHLLLEVFVGERGTVLNKQKHTKTAVSLLNTARQDRGYECVLKCRKIDTLIGCMSISIMCTKL